MFLETKITIYLPNVKLFIKKKRITVSKHSVIQNHCCNKYPYLYQSGFRIKK